MSKAIKYVGTQFTVRCVNCGHLQEGPRPRGTLADVASVTLTPTSGSPTAPCEQRLIESSLATQVVALSVQMSAGFLILVDHVAVATTSLTSDGLERRQLARLGARAELGGSGLPGLGPSTLPRLSHPPSSGATLHGEALPPALTCTHDHRCSVPFTVSTEGFPKK